MVMVIIGVLAAIIMPRVTSQKDFAYTAATKANCESLRSAIKLFESQEGRFPDPPLIELVDGTLPNGRTYLRQIPVEMIYDSANPSNTVVDASTPGASGGWAYDFTGGTHQLWPSFPGFDFDGKTAAEY